MPDRSNSIECQSQQFEIVKNRDWIKEKEWPCAAGCERFFHTSGWFGGHGRRAVGAGPAAPRNEGCRSCPVNVVLNEQ